MIIIYWFKYDMDCLYDNIDNMNILLSIILLGYINMYTKKYQYSIVKVILNILLFMIISFIEIT